MTNISEEIETDIKNEILKKRYFQPSETNWEQLCTRVAKAIAKSPEEEIKFYNLLAKKHFLPNSPTLMNAGTKIGQLSACFVIPVEDSMEGIFDAIKWSALIHKSGGGTGFSFSKLRAAGSPVGSTHGIASGAVSFMTVFDAATEQVKQGGKRRGANMGILNVNHPEIDRFVKSKYEEGILSNFNISVMIDDVFMDKVVSGNSEYSKEIKLFNDIIDGEWKNGEPSVLFYDTINRANVLPSVGDIVATNPCVTGDTMVYTVYGDIPIRDIIDKEIEVYCYDEKTNALKISRAFNIHKTRENAELLDVVTKSTVLRCTPDHLIFTKNRGWVNAEKLVEGDVLIYNTMTTKYDKMELQCVKCVNKISHREDVYDLTVDKYHNFFANGVLISNCGEQPLLPFESCWVGNTIIQTSFGDMKIRDVVDSFVSGNKDIRVLSYDDSNRLVYRVVTNARKTADNADILDVALKSGKVLRCTPDHKLHLKNGSIVVAANLKAGDKIVTCHRHDAAGGSSFRVTNAVYSEEVLEIISGNPEDVYNIEVFETHNYFVKAGKNSYILSNNCNLGSINLSKFVITNIFSKKKDIDWDLLKMTIEESVQFLDNIIDKNKYPIPEIEEMTKKTRKVGLGLMGYHDMLLKMGIPYDSEESIDIGTKVMKFINDVSHEESRRLSKIYGSFPLWSQSTISEPQRNAATTCIAPTGTIAILADCSWGLEPIVSWVSTRKNIDKEFKMVHPIFSEELKLLLQSKYSNPSEIQKKYEHVIDYCHTHGSIQGINWLPEDFKRLFVCSKDISWRRQIQLMAAMQKHVDAAISKTINFDKNATREDIKQAIIMAWVSGCKGITVYRVGSRKEEVISLKQEEKQEETVNFDTEDIEPKFEEPYIIDRPESLFGVTYCRNSGCGKLYTTINHLDGKPYEVFAFSGGSGGCQAQNEAVGRMASLALRNGIDFRRVVRQLKKVKCPVAIKNANSDGKSCSDIIGQLLLLSMGDDIDINFDDKPKKKTWIENFNKYAKQLKQDSASKQTVCPDCGLKLDFGSGCNKGTCRSCGWSGCA
jgi:ribonucleoside-diphosphate reductase alpha chain